MARTPLARDLQRIARSAAQDQAPDASGPSRRGFLRASAALGATTAIGALTTPTARAAGAARIAIVGAGLAGVTCAYRLKQQGYDAVLFEASNRLGGRCWTARDTFDNAQIAEHGGELIDTNHLDILQLAQELRLIADDVLRAQPNNTEDVYYFGQARYPLDRATDDFKVIWQQIHADAIAAPFPQSYHSYTPRGWELDHMSITDWIDRYVPASTRGDDLGPGRAAKLGQLLETVYTNEYGAPAGDQSALNMLSLLAYNSPGQFAPMGPSDERYHLCGGNDQLITKMAETLSPADIKQGHELTAVRRNTDGAYDLTLRSGNKTTAHTCDHIVLALPFATLRSVDLTGAGFSTRKQTAIAQQGMGSNTKLQLQFTNRPWYAHASNGSSYADTGYQSTWEVTRAQAGTTGILNNYTGAEAATALIGADPSAAARTFLTQIEPVLPGITARWNGKATLDAWAGNKWAKGSYSYYRVGQNTAFGGAESEREGNAHFAGEHTTQEWQGWLQGAVFTGQRAAKEILTDLKA